MLTDLADAALHPGELGSRSRPACKEYMIAFLVLETLMIGTFCALDLVALLRVLRGRADPDVPDHRRLGRAAARLLGVQVLPLHACSARC